MSRALILTVVLAVGAVAQEDQVTIRAMSLDRVELPDVFLRGPKGFEAVRFSEVQPSQPFSATAINPLPIYFASPEGEESEIKPDALVKLPPTAGGVLLLAWQGTDGRSYTALPDNLEGVTPRRWLLVNATNDPIGFQLGKDTKPTLVQPGKSTTHQVTVPLNEGAAVTAARIRDGNNKVIFSTYWPVHADQRCIILFVPDGDRVRVRQVIDVTAGRDDEGSG